jgi:hypothetical protein
MKEPIPAVALETTRATMSDIGLEFPPWVRLAFVGMEYWYVLAPVALAFAGIGWFGRFLPMALRRAAWSAAAACAVPFLLLLVLMAEDSVAPTLRAANERSLHRTLSAGEAVKGLFLPAGAVLEFTDATHHQLSSIALPQPMLVAGILLEGPLEPITEREWAGVLLRDQVIGDWPCRAGRLWFTPDGMATHCALAVDHRLAGFDLPAGTDCARSPSTGGWEFQLRQDGPALRIAPLDADLPPGGSLVLAANGALRRLYVPHETVMKIAGVALYDHIIVEGSRLTAELAQPTEVAGVMLPADKVVRLDLSSGKLEATTRSQVVDPL